MWRTILFFTACLFLSVTSLGCCKTLRCKLMNTAENDLECDKGLKVKDVTAEVEKLKRIVPGELGERQYRLVSGCGRTGYYECVPAGVDDLDVDTYRADVRPARTVTDTSWRCWRIPDPFYEKKEKKEENEKKEEHEKKEDVDE